MNKTHAKAPDIFFSLYHNLGQHYNGNDSEVHEWHGTPLHLHSTCRLLNNFNHYSTWNLLEVIVLVCRNQKKIKD